MSRPSGTVPLPRPGPRAQLHYLRHLFTQPHRVLDEIRARHGSVVALGAGPARLAVVVAPETHRELAYVLDRIVGFAPFLLLDGLAEHPAQEAYVFA